MVKSADRVMEVLEWLAALRRPATHSQIAAQLGIPGSSTSALLADMVRRGYLACDAQRQYRVGPAVMRLAGAFLAELDLPRIAEAEIASLAAELRESIGFAVRSGTEMLVVCRSNWPNQLSYALQVGDRAPLATSASGRAFLSVLPKEERALLLGRGRLPAAVEAAMAGGIAFSWQELIVGVNTAAVAVMDASGRPAGSLSLSVPTPRYDAQAFLAQCRRLGEEADRMSRRLGAAAGVEVRLDATMLEPGTSARRTRRSA